MAEPWEKYAAQSDRKPWENYKASEPAPPQEEPRSMLQEFGRQAALTGRAVLEAPANLFALPSDALFGLVNYIQAVRGKEMPFKLASQSIREGYTAAGLPEPETVPEKVAYGVEGALASGLPGVGTGRALAGQAVRATPVPGAINAPPVSVPQAVGDVLAGNLGAQAAGAGAGSVAQQAAAAAGAPLPVQMVAGLAGGALGGAAVPSAPAAVRGAGAVFTPLSEGGRRAIAGRVLQEAIPGANPEQIAQNLEAGQQIVPGSQPTSGQVGGNTGLAYFEQRIRGIGGPEFNTRYGQQNLARQTLLDSIARGGTQRAIDMLIRARDRVTAPLRALAFQQAEGKRVPVENVLRDIDAQLASPDNAGESVQAALRHFRGQIAGRETTTTTPEGIQVAESRPLSDIRSLYAVRKEINRVLEGKFVGAEEPVYRYAGGQLAKVKTAIDDAISEVAPSWRNYLTRYERLSRPINRAQTMQDIRQRTELAAPDIETDRAVTSQAKWKDVVDRSSGELSEVMTPAQMKQLNLITRDLDRGAAAIAAGKVMGSDTAANLALKGQLSVANIVGRVTGNGTKPLPAGWGFLNSVASPLRWLYALPDEAIRSLLVDAMLDPKLAAQLLREGTVENVRNFAESLASSSGVATQSAAAAGAAQAPR